MSVKNQIIAELHKGDRFASQIKDACSIEYRELWGAIAQLKADGVVESYFSDTPPSATLTFRLKRKFEPVHSCRLASEGMRWRELPPTPASSTLQGLLPKPRPLFRSPA